MVKGGYRTENPELTYDKAFSAFFGTPRWKYIKGENGENVVEFTGDCTYQDTPVKARLQFLVDEDNGTFEATYLAFNEVPQTVLVMAALIEKAFEGALETPTTAPTSEPSSSTEPSTANEYPGEIVYAGVPLISCLNASEGSIKEKFGEPT